MKAEQFQVHIDHEDTHWWFHARRDIVGDLVRRIAPASKERLVIDVGCGTGANIAALASEYRCVGTDVAAEPIEAARARFPEVQFIHGVAPSDLGPLAEQADVFLLMDVLEHVEDDHQLLRQLVAGAKPGSQFVLTVPAGPQLWSEHDAAYGHYRRYTMGSFVSLWQTLPLAPRFVSYYNAYLYPIVRASRLVTKRLPGRSLGDAGTDVRMIRPLNRLLYETFRSEGRVLNRLAEGRQSAGFRRGVSLIAILTRQASYRERDVISGRSKSEVELAEPARTEGASTYALGPDQPRP